MLHSKATRVSSNGEGRLVRLELFHFVGILRSAADTGLCLYKVEVRRGFVRIGPVVRVGLENLDSGSP